MNSDSQEIDYEAELALQPWWFRLSWRFAEWRRKRRMAKLSPHQPTPL